MAIEKFLVSAGGFVRDESGAVTVDWVVLTATLILIGVGLGVTINSSTKSTADAASASIATMSVWTY